MEKKKVNNEKTDYRKSLYMHNFLSRDHTRNDYFDKKKNTTSSKPSSDFFPLFFFSRSLPVF